MRASPPLDNEDILIGMPHCMTDGDAGLFQPIPKNLIRLRFWPEASGGSRDFASVRHVSVAHLSPVANRRSWRRWEPAVDMVAEERNCSEVWYPMRTPSRYRCRLAKEWGQGSRIKTRIQFSVLSYPVRQSWCRLQLNLRVTN
jgi:hypothetical protein